MKWTKAFIWMLGIVCCQLLVASERPQIKVIHDGANTVPAKPYYQDIKVKQGNMDAAIENARTQLASLPTAQLQPTMEMYFPINTTQLKVGQPSQKIIKQLTMPLFIIGMDEGSINWLKQNFLELKSIGARGVVVQAKSFKVFAELQREAITKGMIISAMPGDPLAKAYNISTYPVLLRGQ